MVTHFGHHDLRAEYAATTSALTDDQVSAVVWIAVAAPASRTGDVAEAA